MPYSFGDVVLVRFPFTNQVTLKQRPAVVISSSEYNLVKPDLVIAAITSQMHSPLRLGEVGVARWEDANLLKPSLIKPVFATLEQRLISKALGALGPEDLSELRKMLAPVLA